MTTTHSPAASVVGAAAALANPADAFPPGSRVCRATDPTCLGTVSNHGGAWNAVFVRWDSGDAGSCRPAALRLAPVAPPSAPALTPLGWTDEVTACDCCGKAELSGTMALECPETGAVVYYGSTCATRHAGRRGLVGEAAKRRAALQAEFDRRAMHLPAVIAYRAKLAERDRAGIPPGRASADYVREAGNAAREAEQALRAELGLNDAWKRRAARAAGIVGAVAVAMRSQGASAAVQPYTPDLFRDGEAVANAAAAGGLVLAYAALAVVVLAFCATAATWCAEGGSLGLYLPELPRVRLPRPRLPAFAYQRRGGLRFARVGRLSVSWSIARDARRSR